MPITDLSDEERAAARKAAGADLAFLFGKEGVTVRSQGKLYHVGVCSLPRLAAFAQSVGDLKTALRDDLGLDAAGSVEARVQVAAIVGAW